VPKGQLGQGKRLRRNLGCSSWVLTLDLVHNPLSGRLAVATYLLKDAARGERVPPSSRLPKVCSLW